MTSRILGCRESGRRPGRSWPGDGEVSCLSFGLQLAQVWLLCTGCLVTSLPWAAHCSEPLCSGGSAICWSHSWPLGCLDSRGGCSCLQGQRGVLAEIVQHRLQFPQLVRRQKQGFTWGIIPVGLFMHRKWENGCQIPAWQSLEQMPRVQLSCDEQRVCGSRWKSPLTIPCLKKKSENVVLCFMMWTNVITWVEEWWIELESSLSY